MSEFLNNTEKIFCKSCGGENNAANTFCMSCGARIEKSEYKSVTADVVDVVNQGSADNQNPYVNTGTNYKYSPPPTYTNSVEIKRNGADSISIVSLVCGIASIVCCSFGLVIGLVGAITGIISLVKRCNGRGMAIAGIIMSAIAIIFWAIITIAMVLFFLREGTASMYDYYLF